jgi:hypothetical protein
METKADYSKMYTIMTTNAIVAMTNGILHSALLHNVQITRTNAP